MTIKEYQEIYLLDSNSDTYEEQLINILGIDTSKSIEEVTEDIKIRTTLKNYIIPKDNIIIFNNREWILEDLFLNKSWQQWKNLEILLALDQNVVNLNKILSIYFHPKDIPYNSDKQEEIENELLGLDINIANEILNRFFFVVEKYMMHTKTFYLNNLKQQEQQKV